MTCGWLVRWPARVGPRGWPEVVQASQASGGHGLSVVLGVLVLCSGANRESLRRSIVVNTVRAVRNAGSLDRQGTLARPVHSPIHATHSCSPHRVCAARPSRQEIRGQEETGRAGS